MTLLSLKDIVGCEGYYIDDKTLQIYSFKYKKYEHGKLMKPLLNKRGYIEFIFHINGKRKHILYHHIIVKMFIKKDFNSKVEEVDHCDHNRTNNSINNLCVVSKSENQRNISSHKGKLFNFVDNIGRSLIINEEAGIYYSLEYDKFYMYIEHTNKYRELRECVNNGYPYIKYSYNNKSYGFYTKKFRKNLNKK